MVGRDFLLHGNSLIPEPEVGYDRLGGLDGRSHEAVCLGWRKPLVSLMSLGQFQDREGMSAYYFWRGKDLPEIPPTSPDDLSDEDNTPGSKFGDGLFNVMHSNRKMMKDAISKLCDPRWNDTGFAALVGIGLIYE